MICFAIELRLLVDRKSKMITFGDEKCHRLAISYLIQGSVTKIIITTCLTKLTEYHTLHPKKISSFAIINKFGWSYGYVRGLA